MPTRRENFSKAFSDALWEDTEDHRRALRYGREDKGLDPESVPRGSMMVGTNPTFTTAREVLGIADPADVKARNQMGMGAPDTKSGRAGQISARILSDVAGDRTRGAWWLINAVQAIANVAQEGLLSKARPDLWGRQPYLTAKGKPVATDVDSIDEAIKEGLVDAGTERLKKGISRGDDGYYQQRKYPAIYGDLLTAPAALGVNAGLGLLNPIGGNEGYAAAVPGQEDSSKTDNMLMEVAAKYILGRTGNLLPYDEFKKVRPDVSKAEYNAYKAFKWDKEGDYDITDGTFTLPTGVLKGTTDGIHGAELQFLGRSLPLNTTIIPTVAAMAGTTIGAGRTRNPLRGGLVGGLSSYAAGAIGGNLIEQERRNRNMREYVPKTIPLDPESAYV
tara:strand:+ start:267 stop:1436 length:1170 start_codon:yes stop_codon:yes gene_type:complete